jgi:hypothetical protein
MTKKHFIALADSIKQWQETEQGTYDSREVSAAFIQYLADFCAEQNPRFNRERWLGYIAGTNGKNGGKK